MSWVPGANVAASRTVRPSAVRVRLHPRARALAGSSRRSRTARSSRWRSSGSMRCGVRPRADVATLSTESARSSVRSVPLRNRAARWRMRSSLRSTAATVRCPIPAVTSLSATVAWVRRVPAARPTACQHSSVRSRNANTRSTSAAAHAVGVFNAVWATSSATLRSISCPRPVNTGSGERAMAVAIASSSKVASSLRAPPPRMRAMTSTSVRRANEARARVT